MPRILTQEVFGNTLTEEELLLHHTLAPVRLSLLAPAYQALARQNPCCYLSLREDFIQRSMLRKLCPQCVQDDITNFGCGHWRREHQIEGVAICTKHHTLLHDRCAEPDCGKSFFSPPPFLPGQPCPYCHGTATSSGKAAPISEGYAAYCKLYVDALHTPIPEISIGNRRKLWALPHALYGGDIAAFNMDIGYWLGHHWADAFLAYDLAGKFLYDPIAAMSQHHLESGLILLTAFKRFLLGHHKEGVAERWDCEHAGAPDSQGRL
ncbi:TniQ family protein [Aquabacterium olei]|nr:TniQ family protein [Aquabacterium olei]